MSAKKKNLYKAIGFLGGKVIPGEGATRLTLDIDNNKVNFNFMGRNSRHKKKFYDYLESHPNCFLYFRVYPMCLEGAITGFTGLNYYLDCPENYKLNQFEMNGIWQYYPEVSEQPLLTIYRNHHPNGVRKSNIKVKHFSLQSFNEKPFANGSNKSEEVASKPKFYRLLLDFNPSNLELNVSSILDSTKAIPKRRKLFKGEKLNRKKYYKSKSKSKSKSKTEIQSESEPKPKPKEIVNLESLSFPQMKKLANKLRQNGFFAGKLSGKGINKESLLASLKEAIALHPETAKFLTRE